MKKLLSIISMSALAVATAACGFTTRGDGGISSVYGNPLASITNKDAELTNTDPEIGLTYTLSPSDAGGGKRWSGPALNLFGGVIGFRTYEIERGLVSRIDEPVFAAASTIASDTTATDISAESKRTPQGFKHVRYGAAGIASEAQDAEAILKRIAELYGVKVTIDRGRPVPTPRE